MRPKFAHDVWVAMIWVAVILSFLMIIAKNPHEKGTDAHTAIRVCRVGLCLALWSFATGLMGFGLGIAGFVLGIMGIVKGETTYGIGVLVSSMVLPFNGMFFNLFPIVQALR